MKPIQTTYYLMKNRKKILYLASGRSFSSKYPPRKIKEVVECFRAEGYDVEFIGGKDLYKESKKNTYSNEIKYPRSNKLPIPFIKYSLSELADIIHDLKLRKKVEWIIDKEKPDLIWERSSRLHLAGIKSAKKYKIPYVLEWKDNLLSLYGKSFFKIFAKYVEKFKIQNANYIVVESSKLANDISTEERISKDKIFTAINAVNLNDFSIPHNCILRKQLGISDQSLIVTYVGSFAWYHNTELIVKAANVIFKKDEQSNIKFLMVGEGADKVNCIELVKEYGLEDKFIFLGKVEQQEVPNILANSDAAVLPDCLDIILPIKVQEYMAMNLPAIVPNYEANREVITNDFNGILFNPKSAKDLADKIIDLNLKENKRKKLGENARLTVENKLTWKNTWGRALNSVMKNIYH